MHAVATYCAHNTIGFPHIKLKWLETEGKAQQPYLTIKNIIQKHEWNWRYPNPIPYYQDEMERFDKWVRETYCDDATAQG